MHHPHPNPLAFLVADGMSYFGFDLASRVAVAPPTGRRKAAKSAIMIWLSGGGSHIDIWDMKLSRSAEVFTVKR